MPSTSTKLDLTKEMKEYYTAKTEPALVEFHDARFLAIEGVGAPGGTEFVAKVEVLFPLAFGIKNITKRSGNDFVVAKLEGLWWVEAEKPFMDVPRKEWHWKLLIQLPEFVTFDIYEQAKADVITKKKLPLVNDIAFEKMSEGKCVQIMHIGPFSTEDKTIEKMLDFINEHDLIHNGLHHEIYLSDVRRVAPEKMKTILRQPVTKK